MTQQTDIFAALPPTLPPWEDPAVCTDYEVERCWDAEVQRHYHSVRAMRVGEVLKAWRKDSNAAAINFANAMRDKLRLHRQQNLQLE